MWWQCHVGDRKSERKREDRNGYPTTDSRQAPFAVFLAVFRDFCEKKGT
jgi:hypothetical protein